MQVLQIVSEEPEPGSISDKSKTLGCPDQHTANGARGGHDFNQLNTNGQSNQV